MAQEFVLRELPFSIAPVLIDSLWHRRQEQRSDHAWLRLAVAAASKKAFGEKSSVAHDAQVGAGSDAQFLRLLRVVAGTGPGAFHQAPGHAVLRRRGGQESGDLGKEGIHGKGSPKRVCSKDEPRIRVFPRVATPKDARG